jgi:hypothetical protein
MSATDSTLSREKSKLACERANTVSVDGIIKKGKKREKGEKKKGRKK